MFKKPYKKLHLVVNNIAVSRHLEKLKVQGLQAHTYISSQVSRYTNEMQFKKTCPEVFVSWLNHDIILASKNLNAEVVCTKKYINEWP